MYWSPQQTKKDTPPNLSCRVIFLGSPPFFTFRHSCGRMENRNKRLLPPQQEGKPRSSPFLGRPLNQTSTPPPPARSIVTPQRSSSSTSFRDPSSATTLSSSTKKRGTVNLDLVKVTTKGKDSMSVVLSVGLPKVFDEIVTILAQRNFELLHSFREKYSFVEQEVLQAFQMMAYVLEYCRYV